jgi:hypothetical protein
VNWRSVASKIMQKPPICGLHIYHNAKIRILQKKLLEGGIVAELVNVLPYGIKRQRFKSWHGQAFLEHYACVGRSQMTI